MKPEPLRPDPATLRAHALEAALRGRRNRAKVLGRIASLVERSEPFGHVGWGKVVSTSNSNEYLFRPMFIEDQFILNANGALLAALALELGLEKTAEEKARNKVKQTVAEILHSV